MIELENLTSEFGNKDNQQTRVIIMLTMFNGANPFKYNPSAQLFACFANGGIEKLFVFFTTARRDIPHIFDIVPNTVDTGTQLFDKEKLSPIVRDNNSGTVP